MRAWRLLSEEDEGKKEKKRGACGNYLCRLFCGGLCRKEGNKKGGDRAASSPQCYPSPGDPPREGSCLLSSLTGNIHARRKNRCTVSSHGRRTSFRATVFARVCVCVSISECVFVFGSSEDFPTWKKKKLVARRYVAELVESRRQSC